jgi:hypothetical protein
MKKWKNCIFFVMFIVLIVIPSCDNENNECNNETHNEENNNGDNISNYPLLKVVNEHSNIRINSVLLVGYEFRNISITNGNSQTFSLSNGMPGGFNDIIVSVGGWGTYSTRANFTNGRTTTVILRGSFSEGHPYYGNSHLAYIP